MIIKNRTLKIYLLRNKSISLKKELLSIYIFCFQAQFNYICNEICIEPEGTTVPFFNGSKFIFMDLERLIVQLVEQFIDNEQIFLVDVFVKGNSGNQKIQVFIDGDQYVDIDECSKISRKLTSELEEKDIIEGRYVVEVSSPGADRPLKMFRQYKKHVGRELEVLTKEKQKYQGTLLMAGDEGIELSIKSRKVKHAINSETLRLSFEEIDNSKVVIRL